MTDAPQKPDARAVSDWIRDQRSERRVNVSQRGARLDPAVQRADRNNLNDAIRRAGGHDPQHNTDEPGDGQQYPWGSLSDDHQRDDGKDGEA